MLRSRLQLREKLKENWWKHCRLFCLLLLSCWFSVFSSHPYPPSVLLCFLLGAVMIIFGMMFFTPGAEMSMTPMGERVRSAMTKSRSFPKMIVIGFILGFISYHIGAGFAGTGRPGGQVPNLVLILWLPPVWGLSLLSRCCVCCSVWRCRRCCW